MIKDDLRCASSNNEKLYYEIHDGKIDFLPQAFINRELSWLDFNRRVLQQSKDINTPLFEKLNFLSITTNNLDEFIRVRVASLKEQEKNHDEKDLAGYTAARQLELISEKMEKLINEQYKIYNKELLPELANLNINLLKYDDLCEDDRNLLDDFFYERIFPTLSPLAVDSSRPFPLIPNRTLNIALFLKKKENYKYSVYREQSGSAFRKNKKVKNDNEDGACFFASIEIPDILPRLIDLNTIVSLSSEDDGKRLMLIEDLIYSKLDQLFQGFDIVCYSPYRILRNADFELDEDLTEDLLEEIQKRIKERDFADVIHLEVEKNIDDDLLKYLRKSLECKKDDVYFINGPLDLRFTNKIKSYLPSELVKLHSYEKFNPVFPYDFLDLYFDHTESKQSEKNNKTIFDLILEKDRFISLPYESFDPVERLVKLAASDPKVLAIKQTLYRVSGDSPIIAALEEAAKNGKQVMVLVELKARFDEANNINWARKLEFAGCHVIYGLIGLKTHSKITMVVRDEEDGIKRYVHLGTGNYNDATAKIYSDCGIFTAKDEFGEDASNFFNLISGYTEPKSWNELIVAPFDLRLKLEALIDREINNAKEGKQAYIRAKMNSLSDQKMIEKLYEASMAGVKIDLIVRGINCLRAGVQGLSENIRVRSIIGRYLEHARIYQFAASGKDEVYMSSADFMSRNLNRRVELLYPLLDDDCKKRAIDILNLQLLDNRRAFVMGSDGIYKKVNSSGKIAIDSMEIQQTEAIKKIPDNNVLASRCFIPREKSK